MTSVSPSPTRPHLSNRRMIRTDWTRNNERDLRKAETGKQLFSSELDSFNHFTNPVVAGGVVYASSWDGKLYAFGLNK